MDSSPSVQLDCVCCFSAPLPGHSVRAVVAGGGPPAMMAIHRGGARVSYDCRRHVITAFIPPPHLAHGLSDLSCSTGIPRADRACARDATRVPPPGGRAGTGAALQRRIFGGAQPRS